MYTKTNWVDNETPVNAENMNKIETALETHDTALEDKLEKPKADGTQGQILSLGADGKLTYIDKPADGTPGDKGDKGDTGASGLTKQAAIADAAGGDEKDKINAILAALRSAGVIATE